MVGIVLVSHSHNLATALADLVQQVSTADVKIAISAGVGDNREEFGTDAIQLVEAIQEVFSEDGVLVLMDLGSAIMSAETALDFLPPEITEKVVLCPAPFVEGAIAAAVQAGLGSDLQTVCNEARSALIPKNEQIGITPSETQLSGSSKPAENGPAGGDQNKLLIEPGKSVQLTIRNLHGLHARPAARFVKTAASFKSDIKVKDLTNGKGPVTAKSLNAITTLGAVINHQVVISANGPDADDALNELSKIIEQGFGELDEAAPGGKPETASAAAPPGPRAAEQVQTTIVQPGGFKGVPVSEGIAFGPLFHYQVPLPEISTEKINNPETAWQDLQRAIVITQDTIHQRRQQMTPVLGESQASIFDAHELILQDPEMQEKARDLIMTTSLNPAAAWMQSVDATANLYRNLDDPYLQQRAIDVLDVGRQVLFVLIGKQEGLRIDLPDRVILAAQELTPTETSSLDMAKVLGLITSGGGPTSHSAILARALGIPAVAGAGQALSKLEDGTVVGLDGFSGNIWFEPDHGQLKELEKRREAWIAERQRLLQSSHEQAATRDGRRVEVVANVGNVQDAERAQANGAEGIGLLRTEFLFLTRTTPPTEEEQYQALCQIGDAIHSDAIAQERDAKLPVIVRTLDVGGDKELPYVQLAPEANPFLGVRALRLSLRKAELFNPQLRAMLRAGATYNIHVMFPMVANLDEVMQARNAIEQAHQELENEEIAHSWPIKTGIMVEIPSAAILSNVLAPHVDFFSIGTNDLTQYTLAAERGNPLLSEFADALHPAVLNLIRQVAQSAHMYGKFTGVCGELAGDPLAVPVLVGLGVDELSMNPGAIPRAKAILRNIDLEETQALANQILQTSGAKEARQLAQDFYNQTILSRIS